MGRRIRTGRGIFGSLALATVAACHSTRGAPPAHPPDPVRPAPVVVAPRPASAPPEVSSEEPAGTTDAPPCSEPRAVERLSQPVAEKTLVLDPAVPKYQWFDVSESPDPLAPKSPVLSIEDDDKNQLVARASAGGRVLWKTAPLQVAGGVVEAMISKDGKLAARTYSRGDTELFDTKTGRLIAHAGRAMAWAPDMTMMLDPPTEEWGTDTFSRATVLKRTLAAPSKAKEVAVIPGIQPGVPVDRWWSGEFGAAFCQTSAIYAVSHSAELAVFRSSDDKKLASILDPGPGTPVFSESGHLVALLIAGETVATFRLVAVGA